MGYGLYKIRAPFGSRERRRGYMVPDHCNHRCGERIDRGLAYLCYCCTRYFCGRHLTMLFDENDEAIEFECFAGDSTQICQKCAAIEERRLRRERRAA